MNNKIDYNNLKYITANNRSSYAFSEIEDPITFLNEIKKGEKSLEEAKITQENFLEYLNVIRKGNKNVEQKKTLANINMPYNARNEAIKFIEDYGPTILEAKKLAREQEGTGLKILTPNKCLKDYQ